MTEREPINAPLLAGWAIATGVAAVAFGAAFVAAGIDANGSVAIAAVLWLVVGAILGLPRRDLPAPNAVARAGTPVATPAPAAVAVPSAPAPAAASAAAPAVDTGARPVTLSTPLGGQPDDLKKIKGIGPALEALLHEKGYFHYEQIAAWTEAEIAWVDENLEGFKGRVTRDEWVAQAKILAAGGETEFSSRSS